MDTTVFLCPLLGAVEVDHLRARLADTSHLPGRLVVRQNAFADQHRLLPRPRMSRSMLAASIPFWPRSPVMSLNDRLSAE